MRSIWSTAAEYAFYWSIPLGLIVGESAHRFFRRGRVLISIVLVFVAIGFLIFPFVVSKSETAKVSQVAQPAESADISKSVKQ